MISFISIVFVLMNPKKLKLNEFDFKFESTIENSQ